MGEVPDAEPSTRSENAERAEYAGSSAGVDGAFRDLPQKLSSTLTFDSVTFEGLPSSKKFTLWFRHGAKRVFHVRLVRKSSRYLVEMGGMDPSQVLKSVQVCRDHLDRWFGIRPQEITVFEKRRRTNKDAS